MFDLKVLFFYHFNGRPKALISVIVLCLLANFSLAQVTMDSLSLNLSDTLIVPTDTTFQDSLIIGFSDIRLSKDSLDASVDYKARDSMIYDIVNQKIYLYGAAEVKYETITLQAGFIELDWGTNIVTAEGILDSVGKLSEKPNFKDGDQDFTAKRMLYNFKTQKGIIYDVITRQQNLYVLGEKSKFIRTNVTVSPDSTFRQDIIFSQNALFTTCDHEHPHFGIRSKKQKVIPGKLVIVGPSNLEIAGIPTPLFLPFAFFPTTENKTQGLIFPRGYEYSERWGFGLRNIGYYIPVNDYLDLTLSTDVYLKGTWGTSLQVSFNKRYNYNGRLNIGYYRQRNEAPDGTVSFDPSLSFQSNLTQAAGAHPTRRIGGSINIQFNDYQAANFNDAQSVLQGQFSSNMSYNQSFPGKPFTLSAALTHSQSRRSGTMTINFPNLNFQTQTIYPFKHKNPLKPDGTRRKEQWYEEIAFRYQGEARASITGADTLSQFFSAQNISKGLSTGIRHQTTVNTSFRFLKHLSITPSINYTNSMNFKYSSFSFENDIVTIADTIINPADTFDFVINNRLINQGKLQEDTIRGFRQIHEYSASISLNTTLYRTLRFKNGWLRGIRHTVKPAIAMNFSPDYKNPDLGYIFNYSVDNLDGTFTDRETSIFNTSLYRAPQSNQQFAVSYSLSNIYEAKYFSKKDSTEKKLKLFDNIYVGGNFNLAADSLRWSDPSVGGTTRFFKGLSTFNFNALWSFYDLNEKGTKIDRFYWQSTGKPLRFSGATFAISTGLSVNEIVNVLKGKTEETSSRGGSQVDRNQQDIGLADWLGNFRLNHNFDFVLTRTKAGNDTLVVRNNSINVSGNIQLSPKWAIQVGNFGYDFRNKGLSYPSFGFSRDLHCWTLTFQWQPTRNVYTLNLFVTDSPLDFIRVPYRRNQADGRFTGF